jgi:hypothetical protein
MVSRDWEEQREIEREWESREGLGFPCDQPRSFIGLGMVGVAVTAVAMVEMRRDRGLWFGRESPRELASRHDEDKNIVLAVNRARRWSPKVAGDVELDLHRRVDLQREEEEDFFLCSPPLKRYLGLGQLIGPPGGLWPGELFLIFFSCCTFFSIFCFVFSFSS